MTATRRADTLQNVPLTVTAVSNAALQGQGLKTAQDLVQAVPALYITPVNGGFVAGAVLNPQVQIRGIGSSTVGAATTGIYIDDVPLQQRNVIGAGGGGLVFPQLYDLERVEVLEGPQGTLYGGSSEGGTVRFITPQPNFSQNTLNVRVEGSQTQYGDPNAEGGLTVGGPIINDTLAARMSVWDRHDGGYIDHVSQFTGNPLPGGRDTNSADHLSVHGAIAWKPIEPATITISYVLFRNNYRDSDQYWASIPQYVSYLGPGTPGVPYTYCPCNFGPYKSGQNANIGQNFYTSDAQLSPLLSPHSNSLSLPSLTADLALGAVDLKFVSAYADTINDAEPNFSYVDTASRSVTPLEAPYNALPNNGPYIATLPEYSSLFPAHSHITGVTEELRASSVDANATLTWVGGLFYDYTMLSSHSQIIANTGDLAAASLFGAPSAAGTPFEALNGVGLIQQQTMHETQEAVFGEVTYRIFDALRATAGLRVTRDSFSYSLAQGGTLFGYPPGVVATIADSTITQTPVTPKFGLQYVFDPNTNVYATAAKGFRPGGVNSSIPPACQTSLNEAGYPNGAPTTYGSDSLWSYELGSKNTFWGGKATLNGSLYYIDWKDVQTSIGLTCGQGFVVATGAATSKGAELQASVLLLPGVTINLNGAYTDAYYSQDVTAGPVLLVGSGNEIPFTSKWSGLLSAEYRFALAGHSTYARLDYSFHSSMVEGTGPGTSAYSPDNQYLPSTVLLNGRVGTSFGEVSVEAFIQNLTNSQDLLNRNGMASGPGRVSCTNASCSSYFEYAQGAVLTTFRPRTYGMDLEYKF